MSDEPYSIDQVCRMQCCDSNQLHYKIKTYNTGLLVYLKNTVIFEAEINEIDKDELSRLSKLTKEELRKECFLLKNGNLGQVISEINVLMQNDKFKTLWLVRNIKTLHGNGFFELYEDSFDKPTKSIDNLFSGETLVLERLKSEKKGHIRYLQNPYKITLKDIYILPEEVNKISNNRNTLSKDTNTSTPNAHAFKVDAPPITSKNAEPKPSENCRVGTEIICLELERIIEQYCPRHLNQNTMWVTLLNQAETNINSYFEKESTKIIREKSTRKVWDKDKARYHINKVIKWALSIKK